MVHGVLHRVEVLGLELLFAYIGELEDLEGGYGAIQALGYVVLTLPRRLYDLLRSGPAACRPWTGSRG